MGKPTTQDTPVPLVVTVIADLPDSLQPKTVFLDKMPAPEVVTVSKNAGEPLAVLQNKKGEHFLDPEGKPFFMGNGGKSNFS